MGAICESRIERVTVHARGALVTRRVVLPAELPESALDLVTTGISASAEPSSLRAWASGDREIVGLRAERVLPLPGDAPGAAVEALRGLELDRQRLVDRREHLAGRRTALSNLAFSPGSGRRPWQPADPAARIADALALSGLVSVELSRLDAALRELEASLEDNERARHQAALAASQADHGDRLGVTPTLAIHVRLSPGAPGGRLERLEIEYVVQAARWWPVYSARFSEGATRVQWALEAYLAQATGESWENVALSLSTADIAHDARLPELASLRIGRAQPPAPRGYRPLPAGLDAMFAGYDRAQAAARPRAQRESAVDRGEAAAALDAESRVVLGRRDEEQTRVFPMPEPSAGRPPPAPQARAAPPRAPPPSAAPKGAVAAPASASTRAPARERAALRKGGWGSGAGDELSESEEGAWFGAMDEPSPLAAAEPAAIEPATGWLDFDLLALAPPTSPGQRGRLVKTPLEGAGRAGQALVEGLSPPAGARDPRETRGHFDHRYDAAGRCDVPSTGTPHRVRVVAAESACALRFTTVPREAAEVYREAEHPNPFSAPLLAGPVDVFMDGALSATSAIERVDRGGTLRLGLGVEERIRVARNARVDESSAGLLGGSTVVEHAVAIDLSSALGYAATVDVLDRIPVSDERAVEVALAYARPEPESYTQAERGAPLRKGLRFRVEVPAAGKARVELAYRITLPAKSELVGGNRRE